MASVSAGAGGRFVYAANNISNNVSAYTINSITGLLTAIGTIAAGTSPRSVAVDPAGKFAYVANLISNEVSMYTINATTGLLTSIGTIAAGAGPFRLGVSR